MAATQAKPSKKATRKPKAKAKPEPAEPQEEAAAAIQQDALDQLKAVYEENLNDAMGTLHNQFVAFIAESRLPLPQVLIVLEILKAETISIARQKYMGG